MAKSKKDRGLYSVLQKDINKIIISYTTVAIPLIGLIGLSLSPIYTEYKESKQYATESKSSIETDLKQIATLTVQLANKNATLAQKRAKLQESGISREVATSVDNYIRYLDIKATEYGLKLASTDIIVSNNATQSTPLEQQDTTGTTDTTNPNQLADQIQTETGNETAKLIKCQVKGMYSNISSFLSSLNTKQVIYIVDLNITSEPLTDYSVATVLLSLTPPKDANLNILDTPDQAPTQEGTDNNTPSQDNTQQDSTQQEGTNSVDTPVDNSTNQSTDNATEGSEIDNIYGGE